MKTVKGLGKGLESILGTVEAGKGTIKDNMDDLRDILEDEIIKSKSTDDEKKLLLKRLRTFCDTETNIMLVGATGCGKSSTINALFACGVTQQSFEDNEEDDNLDPKISSVTVEVAKVGSKADSETKDIEKYRIGNLVLWDTPGFGDSTELDQHHKELITGLLREKDNEGKALIDLVLVILDGSTKDLGTSYKIINEIIIPELNNETNRILIALNQADIAMKTGRHWDFDKNEPDDVLINYLKEKVESIKKRIKADSGIDVDPVFYCAGYKEESGDVVKPYNLSKLLYYILNSLPAEKRISIMEGINTDSEQYKCNDNEENYNEGIKDSFFDSFDYISDGVDAGADLGMTILGIPGALVGAFLGGVVGCVQTILDEIF